MEDTPQLYATYIELMHIRNDGERRRKQWVILPQLPARLAPGSSPTTSHLSYFWREQDRASHRAVWKYFVDTNDVFTKQLAKTVETHTTAGWDMTPVTTCEIHPTELAAIIKEPKTPYRILQRLQKVARAMHHVDIS